MKYLRLEKRVNSQDEVPGDLKCNRVTYRDKRVNYITDTNQEKTCVVEDMGSREISDVVNIKG